MPDFDTRKQQEPNEPSRHRIALIMDKLRNLSIASKRRILLMARALRDSLMVNRLRTLLIGGILLFVAVAIPVGLLIYSSGGAGDQQATPDPNAEIVFGSEDIGIWTMNADGSDKAQLLDSEVSNPAWSPDGDLIAFNKVVTPDVPESVDSHAISGVASMLADGSNVQNLLEITASEPAWSPDGNEIAYTADSSIYVVDAYGSDEYPRRLTTGRHARDASPAWSPDGNKIAFQRTLSDPYKKEIYVIKACCKESATNKPQQLTNSRGYNTDPTWSPDGTEIAYSYASLKNDSPIVRTTDIYKMYADGSGKTRLTALDSDNEHPESSPAWSPDGDQIAYVRQSGIHAEIYLMKTDGSEPTLATRVKAYYLSVDWR